MRYKYTLNSVLQVMHVELAGSHKTWPELIFAISLSKLDKSALVEYQLCKSGAQLMMICRLIVLQYACGCHRLSLGIHALQRKSSHEVYQFS